MKGSKIRPGQQYLVHIDGVATVVTAVRKAPPSPDKVRNSIWILEDEDGKKHKKGARGIHPLEGSLENGAESPDANAIGGPSENAFIFITTHDIEMDLGLVRVDIPAGSRVTVEPPYEQ